MLVDLHAHYPMHVLPRERRRTQAQLERWKRARLRAWIVRLLSRFFNYQGPGDEPGVTVELMRRGNVGVIFSALYCPFDEMDLSKRYGAPPVGSYFDDLREQIEDVEADIRSHRHAGTDVTIAHSPAELEQALAAGTLALIHSVEGGFHLGGNEREIDEHVATLAGQGVVCITVAHLFWRKLATNAPALPFMPDWFYRLIFRQPHKGLEPLGKAIVTAMARHGILIDVTHMSEAAINDTFALLDELAGEDRIPVLATHMACRPPAGGYAYNLSEEMIERIARRGGLLGLICCEHYISDGQSTPESFADSIKLLCGQIDRICAITGSQDHVAFGSDCDGYIKPALPGLEHMGQMHQLQNALAEHYEAGAARKFYSENALRVIRAHWQQPPSSLLPPPPG